MARRTKIMIICGSLDKERDEYLEWAGVLEEYLGKRAKCFTSERRIETPYAIIDFVHEKPLFRGGYNVVLHIEEDNEKILSLALGEHEK